jgi:DNA gyrase/topoisomerase IV subunit A
MYSDSRSKAGKFDGVPLPRGRAGPVSEPMPPAVSRAADLVAQAAATIDELVAYGQNISDVSERGILHYRQLASTARDKVDSLQKQLTALRADYEGLLASSNERIDTLERTVKEQAAELQKLRAIVWPGIRS